MQCKCGCGRESTTKTGWIIGHWMRGKTSPNKGKKASKETREKQRLAKLGKPRSKEKKKVEDLTGLPCKCGCKCPAETRTGWVSGHWNRGKSHPDKKKPGPLSDEARENISTGQKRRRQREREENPKKLNLCACGCGEMVKGTWRRGHHQRVNNISKRPDIREMRRVSMKKRHEDGIMPEVWNKGKTKETDERVAKYGKTWSDQMPDSFSELELAEFYRADISNSQV